MEDDQVFALEELESRFEMESLVGTSPDAVTDWSSECNIKLSF